MPWPGSWKLTLQRHKAFGEEPEILPKCRVCGGEVATGEGWLVLGVFSGDIDDCPRCLSGSKSSAVQLRSPLP